MRCVNYFRPAMPIIPMANPPSVIPDNILRLMLEKDRKALGKRGMLAAENIEASELRVEKEEHIEVIQWCNLNSVKFIHAPTWKKSTVLPIGWPDFTFLYGRYFRVVEMKVGKNKLSEDQEIIRKELLEQGTLYDVTSSAVETIVLLRGWLRSIGRTC